MSPPSLELHFQHPSQLLLHFLQRLIVWWIRLHSDRLCDTPLLCLACTCRCWSTWTKWYIVPSLLAPFVTASCLEESYILAPCHSPIIWWTIWWAAWGCWSCTCCSTKLLCMSLLRPPINYTASIDSFNLLTCVPLLRQWTGSRDLADHKYLLVQVDQPSQVWRVYYLGPGHCPHFYKWGRSLWIAPPRHVRR